MTASIEVTMDSVDPARSAVFWTEALGYRRLYERGRYVVLGPPAGDSRPRVVIQHVDEITTDKTRVHLDLRVDNPEVEVHRLSALGASVRWVIDETDIGRSRWTTMADPLGTLFCVCSARSEEQ